MPSVKHKWTRAIALLSLVCSPAMAQMAMDSEWVWTPDRSTPSSAPPMWEQFSRSAREPMVSLEAIEFTAIDQLDALTEWNRSNRRPTQNGIIHQLLDQAHVTIGPDASKLQSTAGTTRSAKSDSNGHTIQTSDGDLIWSTSVVVAESYRLRVRLEDIALRDGAQIWVQGAEGEHVGPFGKELIDDEGGLWTPSVAGPELTIVVLVPGEEPTAEFSVTQVAELFKLDNSGQPLINQTLASDTSCQMDKTCVSDSTWEHLDENSKAVAHLHIMTNDGAYACSGGLVTDNVDETRIPYFLTANHCISNQSAASSLEAYWDYKTPYCGGPTPSHSSLNRTNGAKLLVTGSESDFTLLEMNSIPSGRVLMGYNANLSAIAPGTTLHRISYPGDGPQSYSQMKVDGGSGSCPTRPRSSFIYQTLVMGSTQGGSSGAPVMNTAGQIVGQLNGACGNNIDDVCDYSNFDVDGALSAYWPQVQPFLAPQNSTPADLAITILDAESGTYAPGDRLNKEYKVQNIGGLDSTSYRITFYASTDRTITSGDIFLGYLTDEALGPDEIHHFNAFGPVPTGIPDGDYYIGAILKVSDANSSNNVKYDPTRLTFKSTSGIKINPGLNGSWFNPATAGQGFFVDVLPTSGTVFLSWFTFDTIRPPSNYVATLGEPGHRWLTAQGNYSGSKANLNITRTQGGVFDKSSPKPSNNSYGSITLEFRGCNQGTITYSIQGIATNKVIPIERVATDNVGLCESLESQLKSSQAGGELTKEDPIIW